jgi:hypothetical protein
MRLKAFIAAREAAYDDEAPMTPSQEDRRWIERALDEVPLPAAARRDVGGSRLPSRQLRCRARVRPTPRTVEQQSFRVWPLCQCTPRQNFRLFVPSQCRAHCTDRHERRDVSAHRSDRAT